MAREKNFSQIPWRNNHKFLFTFSCIDIFSVLCWFKIVQNWVQLQSYVEKVLIFLITSTYLGIPASRSWLMEQIARLLMIIKDKDAVAFKEPAFMSLWNEKRKVINLFPAVTVHLNWFIKSCTWWLDDRGNGRILCVPRHWEPETLSVAWQHRSRGWGRTALTLRSRESLDDDGAPRWTRPAADTAASAKGALEKSPRLLRNAVVRNSPGPGPCHEPD